LERIVRRRLFWCARADTLNDPEEFAWTCDFTESPRTVRIVADLLKQLKGRPEAIALQIAREVVSSGKLGEFGQQIINDTIRRCREEIGIACFGDAPNNPTLWSRYAGGGSGVCVEVHVPDDLLGKQLHRVKYDNERKLHLDDFMLARNDLGLAALHYSTLLTKSLDWRLEGEVRFLAKRQQIEVVIDGSEITGLYVGPNIDPAVIVQIRNLTGSIPVVPLAATA
jgi:hypothetical protein